MTLAEQFALKAAQNNTKVQENILKHYRGTNSRNWEKEQQEKIRRLVEKNKKQW